MRGHPPPDVPLRTRRLLLLLAALVLPPLSVLLYSFPPTESSYYPRCFFHAATGLHCAGCGTTRCLHALLHGLFAQALAYNALSVAILPYMLFWGARVSWAALRGQPSPRPLLPPWVSRAFLVVVLLFWVLRNVPYYPFTLLAPHEVQRGSITNVGTVDPPPAVTLSSGSVAIRVRQPSM
jgi:hypothetical protein